MKRRMFLTRLTSLSFGILFTTRFPFANTGSVDHSGHDMSEMMDAHAKHTMPEGALKQYKIGSRFFNEQELNAMAQVNDHLMDVARLPMHQPLSTLDRLPNMSRKLGLFRSKIEAKQTTLELIPGVKTDFWTYNDQVPGPMIEVFEGDTIEIEFKNSLPEATTIHWHGLPVPPEQDGNPHDEVKAGESRIYRFTIPEGTYGTYWYHPHGHGTVAEQVYKGLAGVLIVKPKKDPLDVIPVQNWLISDLKIDADGKIAINTLEDWFNGREGQFTLVNGSHQPTISIMSIMRARIWNANSGRYLNLSLPAADIYQVGSDGGYLEKAQKIDKLFLSPGERAEIVIVPRKSGEFLLTSHAYERGKMGNVLPEEDKIIAKVVMNSSTIQPQEIKLRDIPKYPPAKVERKIEYTEIMEAERTDFLINGKLHEMQRNDFECKLNEMEEWTIFNNSHMDHNFHIHGTQFIVLEHELKGVKETPPFLALKDTINLRPYETLRIRFYQQHKGLVMFHCHILEHESTGMMGQINVI